MNRHHRIPSWQCRVGGFENGYTSLMTTNVNVTGEAGFVSHNNNTMTLQQRSRQRRIALDGSGEDSLVCVASKQQVSFSTLPESLSNTQISNTTQHNVWHRFFFCHLRQAICSSLPVPLREPESHFNYTPTQRQKEDDFPLPPRN